MDTKPTQGRAHDSLTLWISHQRRHLTFTPHENYEELRFQTRFELLAYALSIMERQYSLG